MMATESSPGVRRGRLAGLAVGLLLVAAAAAGLRWFVRAAENPVEESVLPPAMQTLVPLHARLGEPQPSDWLTSHPEFGQTCERYTRLRKYLAGNQRKTIYLQPLGEFNPSERKVMERTVEFMGIFYQLPVRVQEALPLSLVPEPATRRMPDGTTQVQTRYVLTQILKPRVPDDALVLVAFTTSDLWPGEGWNFVYGEAMPSERVGVWSICRFGKPDESPEAFRKVLCRTLKASVHETGHLFSFVHCTFYECCMCGSNHLGEVDRHPLWFCPECLGKLCFVTGADLKKRFRELIGFAKAQRLSREEAFWQKSLTRLEPK